MATIHEGVAGVGVTALVSATKRCFRPEFGLGVGEEVDRISWLSGELDGTEETGTKAATGAAELVVTD